MLCLLINVNSQAYTPRVKVWGPRVVRSRALVEQDGCNPECAQLHYGMQTNTGTSVESKLVAAVARAVGASDPTKPGWSVCIKSPNGETLIRLNLAEYGQVSRLAKELQALGYQLEILHPEDMACDFVLKPMTEPGAERQE